MKNCLQRTSSRADPSQADPRRSEPSRAEPAEFFHSDSIGSAVKKSGSGLCEVPHGCSVPRQSFCAGSSEQAARLVPTRLGSQCGGSSAEFWLSTTFAQKGHGHAWGRVSSSAAKGPAYSLNRNPPYSPDRQSTNSLKRHAPFSLDRQSTYSLNRRAPYSLD